MDESHAGTRNGALCQTTSSQWETGSLTSQTRTRKAELILSSGGGLGPDLSSAEHRARVRLFIPFTVKEYLDVVK